MAEVQEHDASSSIHIDDDGFDRLSDSLILLIFNSVFVVKTLIRCRAVSKRFNSLVPHSDSLYLKIDCVISSDSDSDSDSDPNSHLLDFFKSTFKSFFHFISPILLQSESRKSPAEILRQFCRIQRLQIEFPTKDLEDERVVKWRAEFGDALRSCVILSFEEIRNPHGRETMAVDDVDFGFGFGFIAGMKSKVLWTMRILITASARHHVLAEVVEEHLEMKNLVLSDRVGEGVVVIEKNGLEEFRRSRVRHGGEAAEWRRPRTRVPSTTVRMRHWPMMELRQGLWIEDTTLVVVRPTGNASKGEAADVEKEDADLALSAFEGDDDVFTEAVEALLMKGKRFQFEINSF